MQLMVYSVLARSISPTCNIGLSDNDDLSVEYMPFKTSNDGFIEMTGTGLTVYSHTGGDLFTCQAYDAAMPTYSFKRHT